MSRSRWLATFGLGVALVGMMVWTARPPIEGIGWRVAFVGAHTAMFGGLVVLLRVATPTARGVLVGALALRAVAFPMLPSLSDDGYRYVWDGLILTEGGFSPYAYRPSDPELSEWHTEPVYPLLNSPDYYSVYPPVSQAVFAAGASVYHLGGWEANWWVLKLLLTAAEVGGLVTALRVFAPDRVALYAWSPLAVIEIAGQGHTEGLVVGALGALFAAGASRLPVRSVAVALAGGTKLYPLALLPLAWRRDGWGGVAVSAAILVGMAGAIVAGGYGSNVAGSIGLFLGTLDWFSAPYLTLKTLVYPVAGGAAGAVASGVLALVATAVTGLIVLTDDSTDRTFRLGVAVVVVAAVVCAPTLHPWYLIPALFAAPAIGSPRWLIWLCASSSVTYLAYVLGPEWRLPLLIVVWAPTLGLALRASWPRRRNPKHVLHGR